MLFVAGLTAPRGAAAELVVQLRSEVSVTEQMVLLRDVAKITHRDARKAAEAGELERLVAFFIDLMKNSLETSTAAKKPAVQMYSPAPKMSLEPFPVIEYQIPSFNQCQGVAGAPFTEGGQNLTKYLKTIQQILLQILED